ncbi:Bromodomain adjacent to zinc finger domain protein 2b, partial [Temnothorax longispinosus]
MTDAKTNVTSEEIKQETEVINADVDMKEEVKKENEETDEDMTKPLVKTMEDKIVETIPNGDKFNHVNNLHNGKELNGSFISNSSNAEPNWFSILPRETCDTPGPSTKQIFGIAEPTELRIPIFPPPASPSYDRCDSPAPLILTQDEAVQLEYLKVHGLPPPGEAKPVPTDLRYGWWRITDVDTFQELLEHLHSRGVREKELKRTTWATMESFLAVTGKINVDPGNIAATELQGEQDDPNTPIPKPDNPSNWSEQVALRVDAQLLEQVEALEDKVANASMQVKGWKLPPRAGTEEAEEIEKLNEMEKISAVEQARQRLLSLEAAIERRYLKPPLGV